MKKTVSLESGNGGHEMSQFLNSFLSKLYRGNKWSNFTNDSATFPLPNKDTLCFTTDSFVVNPIKFPGGNIGHLAMCGTINDLAVMGCDPIGLSLSFIVEEGFDQETLEEIVESINNISKELDIPIVTGDTKVMEKGAIDKIVINTSGVGIAKKILDEKLEVGDKIIISGGIGEHGVALLSQRFDFETEIVSDSKPVYEEMKEIRDLVKFAKDPTRGGIAAILNEVAKDNKLEIELLEEDIPIKKEVKKACELLGIDVFSLANEGRVAVVCKSQNADEVVSKLKEFNLMATVIGEVKNTRENGIVILKTELGSRILSMPSGKIVPRIC